MLVLKNARQIKWPDLKHIEDPFHAKNTLASNLFRPAGGEHILNEGGFNLPKKIIKVLSRYRISHLNCKLGKLF